MKSHCFFVLLEKFMASSTAPHFSHFDLLMSNCLDCTNQLLEISCHSGLLKKVVVLYVQTVVCRDVNNS